jgi:hypothetical protein
LLLTWNPRNQGFLLELKSSLRNYYVVTCLTWNICSITNDHGYVTLDVYTSRSYLIFMTYHRLCN